MIILLISSPGLAQGVSDHELGAFVSTIVSTLVSMVALVFATAVKIIFKMFVFWFCNTETLQVDDILIYHMGCLTELV